MPHRSPPQTTSFLTFESWVTKLQLYEYAQHRTECVPNLLIDRALCEEPFLDAFAASPAERRAVISAICRCRKPKAGDRFICRTLIVPLVKILRQALR